MYTQLKKHLFETCQLLIKSGIVPSDAFVSVKDTATGCYAYNSACVGFNDIKENDIIVVDTQGNVLEGDAAGKNPFFSVHKAIYNGNGDVTVVMNPRTRWNCIWAQLGKTLPPTSFFYAKYFSGEIRCTNILMLEPGEDLYEMMAKEVEKTFINRGVQSRGAVVLRHDSVMLWGKNPTAAAERAVALEEICYRAAQAEAITHGANGYVAWEVSEQLLTEE